MDSQLPLTAVERIQAALEKIEKDYKDSPVWPENDVRNSNAVKAHLDIGFGILYRTFNYAMRLDGLVGGMETPGNYVQNVSLEDPRALNSLHQLIVLERIEVTGNRLPYSKALHRRDAPESWAKRTLHEIRERLRDGYSPDAALLNARKFLLRACETPSVTFIKDLAEVFRLHAKGRISRNQRDWIEKLWLTLNLWECPSDGAEAHTRFRAASPLHGFHLGEGATAYRSFQRGWQAFRNTQIGKDRL